MQIILPLAVAGHLLDKFRVATLANQKVALEMANHPEAKEAIAAAIAKLQTAELSESGRVNKFITYEVANGELFIDVDSAITVMVVGHLLDGITVFAEMLLAIKKLGFLDRLTASLSGYMNSANSLFSRSK